MYIDYHVHSEYSDDSIYPMEEVVKDAIAKGIEELCFTDHVDYGIKPDVGENTEIKYQKGGPGEPELMPILNVDYPKYFAEIKHLQDKYKGQISIKKGLEFGMQTHTIEKYEKLYAKYPMDFIILSIHEINDKELWTQDYQKDKTQEEYIFGYYNEMLKVIENYKNYSVLGHLDLITRYDLQPPMPFEAIKPIITKIFKQIIADDKGIELNTSYARYGLKDTTPSKDILKLYHDLGGQIITIGSDSHKKEHLGMYINEAKDILSKIGFKYYCTYDNMKPNFHLLSKV